MKDKKRKCESCGKTLSLYNTNKKRKCYACQIKEGDLLEDVFDGGDVAKYREVK